MQFLCQDLTEISLQFIKIQMQLITIYQNSNAINYNLSRLNCNQFIIFYQTVLAIKIKSKRIIYRIYTWYIYEHLFIFIDHITLSQAKK